MSRSQTPVPASPTRDDFESTVMEARPPAVPAAPAVTLRRGDDSHSVAVVESPHSQGSQASVPTSPTQDEQIVLTEKARSQAESTATVETQLLGAAHGEAAEPPHPMHDEQNIIGPTDVEAGSPSEPWASRMTTELAATSPSSEMDLLHSTVNLGDGSHSAIAMQKAEAAEMPPPSSARDVVLPPGLPGRQRPLSSYLQMIFFLLAGTLTAIGHHVFYQGSDGKPVGSTGWVIAGHIISPQRRAALIATGLVFLAKTLFGLSVAKAYNENFWSTAHRTPLQLTTMDALFGALNDPAAFLETRMLINAKTSTLLALLSWCLPLAVIAVPGALSVTRISKVANNRFVAPTINLVDLSGDSLAFYGPASQRSYLKPSAFMFSFASRVLTTGQILAWPSPPGCGPDCSYNQIFFGPSFSCSDAISNQTGSATLRWEASTEQGNTSDALSVRWLSSLDGPTQSFTTCVSHNSTYDIDVRYVNGTQHIDIRSIELHDSFGTLSPLTMWNTPGSGSFEQNPKGLALLSAIKDSVATAMSGAISIGRQTGIYVSGTLVLYSTFPSYGNLNATSSGNGETLVFPLNVPKLIEDLTHNVTISLISASLWNASTLASVQSTANVFQYDPRPLWAGYGACIGATLIAIAMGMNAVRLNGGSGDRSFTLLVATTRNPSLDDLFAVQDRARLQELKRTKVTLGLLEGERPAFRTEDFGQKQTGQSGA